MRARPLLGITIVLGYCLAGCSSRVFTGISSKYPPAWAATLPTTDPEASIQGTYENLGDFTFNPHATKSEPKPALATMLGGLPTAAQEKAIGVRIKRLGAGGLEIAVIGGNGSLSQTVLQSAKNDYRVEDGAIWLPVHKKSYSDGTGYVRESDSLGFRKAADGSLVCEWRHGSKALAMWIVPMAGSQVFWMRWPARADN